MTTNKTSPTAYSRTTRILLLVLPATAVLYILLGPVASFALLTGLIILAMLFFRPELFLLGSVALYTVFQDQLANLPISLLGANLYASQFFMVALALSLGIRVFFSFATRETSPSIPSIFRFHLLFVVYAALTLLLAREFYSLVVVGRLFACFLAHYAGFWLATTGRAQYVYYSIAVASLVAGFSTAVTGLADTPVTTRISVGAIREGGSFGGPVGAATIAMVGLPVFLAFLRRSDYSHKILALTGFLAIACAALFTLTRTLFLGTALFVILVPLLGSKTIQSRPRRILLMLLPLTVLALALLLAPTEALESRLDDIPGVGSSAPHDLSYASNRGVIWTGVLRLYANSPLPKKFFGTGIATVRDDLLHLIGLQKDAHNSYLEVLYGLGIFGLALYLLFLFDNVRYLRVATVRDPQSAFTRDAWVAYYLAFMLSTMLFNGYVLAIGPRWFTYLGLGAIQGTLFLTARPTPIDSSLEEPDSSLPAQG